MVRLFDDKMCVEISIRKWEGDFSGYSVDCSDDYYNVGGLEYDWKKDAYRVEDVQYCIDILDDPDEGINAGIEEESEKVWESFVDIIEEF